MGAGYSDWIWVPYFRRCRVGEHKIEVTHPIAFGQGFLFDGTRRVVTIRQCLFGLTLSREEIPFSDANIRVVSRRPALASGIEYLIELEVYDGRRFKVLEARNLGDVGPQSHYEERVNRILAAIKKLGL